MIKEKIQEKVKLALQALAIEDINIIIQNPRNQQDVDYATNIAMLLSKKLDKSPSNIASEIIAEIESKDDGFFDTITIAGPGFINFKINPNQYLKNLPFMIKEGSNYGRSKIGKGQKALVEFVSANPTGPLTIGHGRGAIIGEFASTILDWNGYQVEREYYFNNAGRQMRVLAESVYARYKESLNQKAEFPDDGYKGEYIYGIAKQLNSKFSDELSATKNLELIKDYSEKIIFEQIKKTLKKIGIVFDNFFNENELYENKEIYKIVAILKEKSLVYEKDGATWFKASDLGLNQDRVLIKSSGEPTYRLPDIAYHKNKFDRNYDVIVDVFGADHLDAYPDVLGACEALGYDKSKVKVLVHQFVTIQDGGKPIKMSTRKANFISLDDLIDEVGADVVKYFFAMRGMNSHLNFDLGLAKDESDQNPVFYIQYAYARIINILNKACDEGFSLDDNFDYGLLNKKEEIAITKSLLTFPDLIKKAGSSMEPQMIANYLMDIASSFHHYYAVHKVITEERELSIARLNLINAVKQVLYNGLNILNISTPNKM
tara:strand:+ start:642 stop:2276 length:1635 start_codon:yes stop_codon:yes gene_type:complete